MAVAAPTRSGTNFKTRECLGRHWLEVEQMYTMGCTTFRISGRHVAEHSHRLRRGVHQGCPLSVVFFNGIQIPVAVMIEREFPEAGVIIYADDVGDIWQQAVRVAGHCRTAPVLLWAHRNPTQ